MISRLIAAGLFQGKISSIYLQCFGLLQSDGPHRDVINQLILKREPPTSHPIDIHTEFTAGRTTASSPQRRRGKESFLTQRLWTESP